MKDLRLYYLSPHRTAGGSLFLLTGLLGRFAAVRFT